MTRYCYLVLGFMSVVGLAADGAGLLPQAGSVSPLVANTTESSDAITIPKLLSYQGRLTDSIGRPVRDSIYQITFRLYTVPSGGSPFWSETQTVMTRGGLFSVLLGEVDDIDTVPQAGGLYLGMVVEGGAELAPRLRLVSAAYAYLAARADTANFVLGGASDNAWVRGTPDSVLYTIRRLGIARGGSDNMLFGDFRTSHTNLGVACTTGTDGQNYGFCSVGGGRGNKATSPGATVCGGYFNTARGIAAVIGGGSYNTANDTWATVAGGYADTASGYCATVGGGAGNTASSICATIGGGWINRSIGIWATVGGGAGNTASGGEATVAGGAGNTASGICAAVGGGLSNAASGNSATVAGGSMILRLPPIALPPTTVR